MEHWKCSSYCQHEIQNFTRCDCVETKTAVKYTQFKQLHKALKSEINNKAVQILTSVLETKHILTSAEFKIYSQFKITFWNSGMGEHCSFCCLTRAPWNFLPIELRLCVRACSAAQVLRLGWPRQPRWGWGPGCIARGSRAGAQSLCSPAWLSLQLALPCSGFPGGPVWNNKLSISAISQVSPPEPL